MREFQAQPTGSHDATSRIVRFGTFEFDSGIPELRRRGLKIRLLGQPIRILAMLLERPGEVVTREEIRRVLWHHDTFVNFEQSLNAAIKRLRQALGDSAVHPRFIETLPRRGYRFIAPTRLAESVAVQVQPPTAIDSIAVLPFENSTTVPDTEFLSDGITETIIDILSRLSGIRVMARGTVFHYKRREIDPRSVGRELNVQAVLMGRILIRGEDLRIGTELVESSTGQRLWGEQYCRRISDILDIEQEISREISEKLRLRLSSNDRHYLAKRFAGDVQAYGDYLKGRYHQNKMTDASLRESLVCYHRAVERDPGFALAYASVAEVYGLLPFFGIQSPLEALPRARDAALHALALDESLAAAHCSLAGVRKFYEWNWAAAESGYRRSLELQPNDANGHRLYAAMLSALGRSQEALREIYRAQELDPLSLLISMETAWHHYMARDYRGAIDRSVHTLELEPAFTPARHVLGLAYEQLGRVEEAMSAFESAYTGSGRNPASLAGLGRILVAAGRRADALASLTQLDGLSNSAYVPPYYRALILAALGEGAAALDSLEDSCRRRDGWLVWLKCDPRLDALRSDSRFESLLHQIGLAP